jgi:hypothetical protein
MKHHPGEWQIEIVVYEEKIGNTGDRSCLSQSKELN